MTAEGGVASPEDAPTGKEMEPVGNGHAGVEGSNAERSPMPSLNKPVGAGVINPVNGTTLASPDQVPLNPARQLPENLGAADTQAGSSAGLGRWHGVASQGTRESLIPDRESSYKFVRTTSEGSSSMSLMHNGAKKILKDDSGRVRSDDNQEQVTMATDSITAHEILFARKKIADEHVTSQSLEKTQSEGALRRIAREGHDPSLFVSLKQGAKGMKEKVYSMFGSQNSSAEIQDALKKRESTSTKLPPPMPVLATASQDGKRLSKDSANTSLRGGGAGAGHTRSRRSSITESLRRMFSGASGERGGSPTRVDSRSQSIFSVDGTDDDELRAKVQGTFNNLQASNQPRQRWVTATWYAAQEVQRKQEDDGEKESKEKLPLHLGEAVMAVLERDENTDKKAKMKKRAEYRVRMLSYVDSSVSTAVTLTATLFVLYAADFHFLLVQDPKYGDEVIYALNFVCALIFLAEVFFRSAFQRKTRTGEKFFLSFFFWLDVIAIISLIPDIVFWMSSIGSKDGINGGIDMWSAGSENAQGGFDLLTLARSGRAARAGARAARIIRVLNFVHRLKKIHADRIAERDHQQQEMLEAERFPVEKLSTFIGTKSCDEEHATVVRPKAAVHEEAENDMGSKLDARITRYFVYCVGTMLIVAIIVSAALERSFPVEVQGDLKALGVVLMSTGFDYQHPIWVAYLDQFIKSKLQAQNQVLWLACGNSTIYGSIDNIRAYRSSPPTVLRLEAQLVVGDADRLLRLHLTDVFGTNNDLIGNISFTTTVICILGGLTWMMTTSVRREIVVPMEGLMQIIRSIRRDPMKPIGIRAEGASKVAEVAAVEQALVQLGALLQMGLGEAGAKIIRTSLKDHGLDVNVAGKIVQAIYGFCDIRNFTDCTEVLQADVVKLVNNVGSIVHGVTIENHGAPNKNIGDAFLLVWKPKGSLTVRQIAESALRSYVSIIIEMSRDSTLKRWAARHDIQERMPGYVVRLGCGLHYGWAIECAIGSQHKIDASYLSPHVNLSSRLEAATKQYGVMILLSGEMHSLMSDEVKNLCRLIDRVTVKGSNAPMYLYTYDVPTLQSFGGSLADDIQLDLKSLTLYDYWKRVRPYTGEKFRLSWQMAMHAYLGGADGTQADWKLAKSYLTKCLASFPNDGPALAIIAYMDNNSVNGVQPESWKGFRGLTDK